MARISIRLSRPVKPSPYFARAHAIHLVLVPVPLPVPVPVHAFVILWEHEHGRYELEQRSSLCALRVLQRVSMPRTGTESKYEQSSTGTATWARRTGTRAQARAKYEPADFT